MNGSAVSDLRGLLRSYRAKRISEGNCEAPPNTLATTVNVDPTVIPVNVCTTFPSLSATSISTVGPYGVPHGVSTQLIPPLPQCAGVLPRYPEAEQQGVLSGGGHGHVHPDGGHVAPLRFPVAETLSAACECCSQNPASYLKQQWMCVGRNGVCSQ